MTERGEKPMTFGSLFAGIGGFDLGFERGGLTCKWQVEIDPYCNRVLEKHWPNVRRHDDIRTFPPTDADDWRIDVICGGFPCQDISYAGKGAGLGGERSGLWREYARIIRVLRPRFVVVENVAAILVRGIDRVLGDLAESGYDAEWQIIPAAVVGAPHIRERVFVLGRDANRINDRSEQAGDAENTNTKGVGREKAFSANASGARFQVGQGCDSSGAWPSEWPQLIRSEWWATEPNVGRVAHGVPARVDRLSGLGNAVVPQVAEWIAHRLLAAAYPLDADAYHAEDGT